MRKTSTYSRKRAHRAPLRAVGIFEQTARCIPYAENPIYNATTQLLRVRSALDGFMIRTIPGTDTYQHDELAHAFGLAEVRFLEIGGRDNNPAIDVLLAGSSALFRMRERWQRIGEWGLDGLGIQQLKDAVSLFEDVFQASSPLQIHDAAMTRNKWLQMQWKKEATEC